MMYTRSQLWLKENYRNFVQAEWVNISKRSEQKQKNSTDSGTKLTCIHDLAPYLVTIPYYNLILKFGAAIRRTRSTRFLKLIDAEFSFILCKWNNLNT